MSEWSRVSLSEVADFYSGGTPSKANPTYWIGSIPWVSPKDMGADEIDGAEDSISEEAVAASATRVVPAETILAVTRSGILARKFPIAVTTLPVAFNQDIRAIRPKNGTLSARYLFHFLRAKEADVLHAGVKKGATVHSLVSGYLEHLAIPLPPTEEQLRIAAALDRAARLVKLHKQAAAKTRDLIPALFVEMFGDPATNPMGWPIAQIGTVLAEKPKYGTMVPAKASDGTFLCIRVGNIQDNLIDLRDRKYVDLAQNDLERHAVRDGDLLLARAIGSQHHLGKAVVARPEGAAWAFDSHVMRLRFRSDALAPEYFHSLISTSTGKSRVFGQGRRSAVQFNVNAKEIGAATIPIPPLGSQQDFVRRVRSLQSAFAASLVATDTADELHRSLLAEIFGSPGS